MKQLDQIALKAIDRTAIERSAATLRERFPVERVVLFGSKARGDDGPDSDIDLLVLTGRKLSWDEQREMTRSLFKLEMEMGVLISLVVYPLEEWEHGIYQATPLRWEIDAEGVAA